VLEIFLGVKEQPARNADDLTAICEPTFSFGKFKNMYQFGNLAINFRATSTMNLVNNVEKTSGYLAIRVLWRTSRRGLA
jgi:hypothetical protein